MNAMPQAPVVTNQLGQRVHGSLARLVGRIRYAYRQRRTYIATPSEIEACREKKWEDDCDIIQRIADKARVDWLRENSTGEVRFFEGM